MIVRPMSTGSCTAKLSKIGRTRCRPSHYDSMTTLSSGDFTMEHAITAEVSASSPAYDITRMLGQWNAHDHHR